MWTIFMITLPFSFRSLKNDSSCCFHNTSTIALHNFAWEGWEILKNDKTPKLTYTCNSSAPTASIYHPTLCNFCWTSQLSLSRSETCTFKLQRKGYHFIRGQIAQTPLPINGPLQHPSWFVSIMGVSSTDSHKQAGAEKMCLMPPSCWWHIFCR